MCLETCQIHVPEIMPYKQLIQNIKISGHHTLIAPDGEIDRNDIGDF